VAARSETVEMKPNLEGDWAVWLMSIASKPADSPDAGGTTDAGGSSDGGALNSTDSGSTADGGETPQPDEPLDSGTNVPIGVESPVSPLARSYTVRSSCGTAPESALPWVLGILASLWLARRNTPELRCR
jgi:hypothetical protein